MERRGMGTVMAWASRNASEPAVALILVRFVLPAVIAVVGIVLVSTGGDSARGAGIVLIGVALLVVLANLFIRLGLLSERDREEEARRRER
jgi:hypothetical protein